MQFTYTYLKSADENKMRVGNYEGKPVFAITKDRLEDTADDRYYYIIYDDNNYLYNNGYVYAMIESNGDVNHFSKRRYLTRREAPAVAKEEPLPQTTTSSSTTGDVVLELMIEDVLTGARTMTVDSLLEGFEYGLD